VTHAAELVDCRSILRNGWRLHASGEAVSVPRRYARKHSKRDGNHAVIAEALTKAGAVVIDTSSLGSGFPDILVGYRGRWLPIEIKLTRKHLLTDLEMEFLAKCKDRKLPHAVVSSIDEAIQAIESKWL
jgi:hypothetical protein